MLQTDRALPAAEALLQDLLQNENILIHIIYDDSAGLRYDEAFERQTDEKAFLEINETPRGFDVLLRCSGEKSAFYALCEIDRRLKRGDLEAGTYQVSPSFALRGYIEGFYGTPWTQTQRLSVMELMAKYRMNTVFYAPKDDPYHRERWRELYPEDRLTELKTLTSHAKSFFLNFYWCVSPGLSIRYTDETDFEALCAKAKQISDLGVRHFGLLLDDIDETLRDESDKKTYGTLVNAHIGLVNRFYIFLTETVPDAKLAVCPTVYHGGGDEPYITELGKGIHPDIDIFWTGRDICSRSLTVPEALFFAENTGHKPLYWDNYPVNDEAMFREMHLGPVIGRDKQLPYAANGLIANCMEYAECSKIPLCTVADYLWDSARYDAEASFETAVGEAAGRENARAFLTFADHLYTSCLQNENSRRLINAFQTVGKAVSGGDTVSAKKIAEAYLRDAKQSLTFLSGEHPLCGELAPWIKKYKFAVVIIRNLFSYMLSSQRDAMREDLLEMIELYAADPTVLIHEFVFREVLMDRYFY